MSPVAKIISSSGLFIFLLFFIGGYFLLPSYRGATSSVDSQNSAEVSHMMQEGFDDYRAGKYQETINTLDSLISKYGSTVTKSTLGTAYGLRGDAKAEIGDPAGALADLQQAVILRPADKLSWADLAGRYRAMGNINESRNSFEKAISLDPKNLLQPKNEDLKSEEASLIQK